jgi:hypothetical protein
MSWDQQAHSESLSTEKHQRVRSFEEYRKKLRKDDNPADTSAFPDTSAFSKGTCRQIPERQWGKALSSMALEQQLRIAALQS